MAHPLTVPTPTGSDGHRHYTYERTIEFPETFASVRGSDALGDLATLSDIHAGGGKFSPTGSTVRANERGEHEDGHRSSKLHSQPSVIELDDVSLNIKVKEWLEEREQKVPYPSYLGLRKHFLRIINTLDYDEKVMEVGNYMTVNDVVKFYSDYNSNCREYVWKDIWGTTLQMSKSLGENGLTDHSAIIDEIGLDHFPTILLYFKDGFENDPPLKLDISQPEPTGLNAPCRNY